jgi:hypothetical protein
MWRQRLAVFLVVAFPALVLLSSITSAQAPGTNAPVPGLPTDGNLDTLLAARNWNGLADALSRPITSDEFARKLNWLRTRMDNGGGFLLALLYTRDLWFAGNSAKINDPAKDPRITAALVLLYAYEIIVIDGAKCEDRSAPENRINQLLSGQAATLGFLRQQQADLKSKMLDIAIALERKTAPLRREDDLICRDGMDQMRAGLERGTQQQMPNAPGVVGKRIAVTPPADWTPKFVSPDVYRPMQDKARADMRGNLLRLVGQPS